MRISSYRAMWVLTMFDLPVDSQRARHNYAAFRKFLLKDGFSMIQFSVYARHCPSKENADVHIGRIEAHLPPNGSIRVLTVTDRQFEKMFVFWGKMRGKPENASRQLTFF
jgi:CRISPR-associated protein Cas2